MTNMHAQLQLRIGSLCEYVVINMAERLEKV